MYYNHSEPEKKYTHTDTHGWMSERERELGEKKLDRSKIEAKKMQ